VEPLEALSDKLARSWGTVTHLKAVKDSEALRAAVEAIQPKQVELSLKFSQSKPLYDAFCALRDGLLPPPSSTPSLAHHPCAVPERVGRRRSELAPPASPPTQPCVAHHHRAHSDTALRGAPPPRSQRR
jgi:hypothetical protein